jgi:glycosyltransferase 2 family protein
MIRPITGIAGFVRDRVGWHGIGVITSLLIIAVACVTLFHLLRDIEIAKVIAALRATSPRAVLIAACLIAGGYITLTFFDLFALRTIGRADVPYRIAALASFTSYTMGHNLGATALVGGVVRYRIYSSWRITVIDVAKIAFITGLTFWLGNTVMLGVGMAYAPEAASTINLLPPSINRWVALAGLAAITGYMIWLIPRPRVIGCNDWQITLPGARLTLLQIGLGILDLGCTGLAMYTLLPADADVELVHAIVVYVMAMLLGFVSHAPGTLGVFDAAMLVGLGGIEKEQLLASLLAFRALYFLLPFTLALMILGVREVRSAVRGRPLNEAAVHPAARSCGDARMQFRDLFRDNQTDHRRTR